MFYQIDEIRKKIDIKDINEKHQYIGMMSLEELKQCYQQLHIYSRVMHYFEDITLLDQNIVIPHKNYYYGFINLINARNIFMKRDSLAFFIFSNLFLVIVIDDEDHHIEDIFHITSDYVLEKGMSMTRIIYYFLSELIGRDYQYIEELQEEVEELDEYDMNDNSLLFTKHFKKLNKELLLLSNYYDNFISIGEELQMNHHDIFEKDDMRYFEVFTHRLERFSHNIQMLKELLNQAYDVHQSRLEYKLNKTMQFFTVVTTIFMPLTLITGWYGMNFKNMPEINFTYSYYIVIVVSLLIVGGLIYLFKKKKFF